MLENGDNWMTLCIAGGAFAKEKLLTLSELLIDTDESEEEDDAICVSGCVLWDGVMIDGKEQEVDFVIAVERLKLVATEVIYEVVVVH